MKLRPDHGVLLISIDVAAESSAPHVADSSAATDSAAVLDATKWLVNLLDRCRLPATWFLAGPGTSVLRSQIVAAEMRHEIGLLVSENCQSQRARLEFSRHLDRRLLAARAAGVEISSLGTREPKRIEHLDLLVKHGIRAVRHGDRLQENITARRVGWSAVSTLRFGISSLPATLYASEPGRWPRWAKDWDDHRQLSSAARRAQYCHMLIDIRNLVGARARKRLQTTLRVAARLFDSPGCRVETISSLAAALMARPIARGAQSILRAA